MSFLVAFISGVVLFQALRFFPYSALAVSLAASAAIAARRHGSGSLRSLRTLGVPLGLALVAGIGLFHARTHDTSTAPPSLPADRAVLLKGTVLSEGVPLRAPSSLFLQTVAVHRAVDSGNREVRLGEVRIVTDTALAPDTRYEISATLFGERTLLNPGLHWEGSRTSSLGYAAWARTEEAAPAGGFAAARKKLRNFIKRSFSAPAASFLLSIIIGEQSLITRETRDAFNATGLAHLLSISGAHFGLLLVVVFGLIRAVLKRLPSRILARLSLYATPSQAAALLSLPFIAAYLGISLENYPALRAFIMISLFLFGLVLQRRRFWLTALLFAAVVILLLQPDAYADLSFQLSFVAVLCIGLAAEQGLAGKRLQEEQGRAEPEAPGIFRHALSYIKTSALFSCAATFGTAPLVAYCFHYVSVISPLANLIVTPLVGLLILPLSLFSSLAFLLSGYFPFLSVIEGLTAGTLSLIDRTAQLPAASLAVPAFPPILLVFFYGALFFYAAMSVREQRPQLSITLFRILPLCVALVPFFVYAVVKTSVPQRLCATFLDVGQGDAAVVELPDRNVVVVDTGGNGSAVSRYLRSRGITTIHALALSHGQSDHAGGLRTLIEEFDVKEVWDNGRLRYPEGSLKEAAHRRLERGEVLSGRGYAITVLHPYEGFVPSGSGYEAENNDSLVLKIQGGGVSFLFTGDLGKEGQESLLPLGGYLKSTVLKAPHHGSKSSGSAAFFGAVDPEVAVISVGRNNRYGHPHEEVLALLNGARVVRTDRDGAVGVCEADGGEPEVKRAADFVLREPSGVRDEVINFKKLFLLW